MANEDSIPGNAIPERPLEVTAGVYILCLGMLFLAERALVEWTLPGGESSQGSASLMGLPIGGFIYWMIWKGKNWARITFVVLSLLGILSFVIESFAKTPISESIAISRASLTVAEAAIDLLALFLLFRPASSEWFEAVKSLRKRERSKRVSVPVPVDETRVEEAPPKNLWKRLLFALRNTNQPMISYVWRAWLIAFVPMIVPAVLVGTLLPGKTPSFDGPVVGTVVGVLFLSPWLETLTMWPILWILTKTIKKTLWVAAVSALGWGALHSTAAPAWGLTTTWPFFVLSLCFLEWQRKSTGKAITATALVHMCQNAVPAIFIVIAVLAGDDPCPQKAVPSTPPSQQISGPTAAGKKTPSSGPTVQATQPEKTEDLKEKGRKKEPAAGVL